MQSKETHTATTHHNPSNPPTNPTTEWRWGKRSANCFGIEIFTETTHEPFRHRTQPLPSLVSPFRHQDPHRNQRRRSNHTIAHSPPMPTNPAPPMPTNLATHRRRWTQPARHPQDRSTHHHDPIRNREMREALERKKKWEGKKEERREAGQREKERKRENIFLMREKNKILFFSFSFLL